MRPRELDPHIGSSTVSAAAGSGTSAMRASYGIHDRESESGATSRARAVTAREALEGVPVQRQVESRAAVEHVQPHRTL
jgi:hypothetical protein